MEKALPEKYLVEEKIGGGGSGTVYRVWDRNLEKHMAVKEMEASGIWEREKEILKTLRHPALPVITDCFEQNGKQYLVMDYIEGITLLQYMDKCGRIRQKQAVAWAKELAEVLGYLHEQRIPLIYRDMKPSNIMIDRDGKVKLIDFGTVFLRHMDAKDSFVRAGTFGYAAPEQFGGDAFEQTDERSDIYGLGATLHHMLTGKNPAQPPFCKAPIGSYDRTLSPELEKIVDRALRDEKTERYRSMRQMKEELESLYAREKRTRVGKRAAASVYFTLLFLTGGGFFMAYYQAEFYEYEAVMRALWEDRMLLCSFAVLCLCLGRWGWEKLCGRKRGKQVRTYRSVYLSEKKGAGLPLLLAGVMLTVSLSVSKAAATGGEETLPVTVYDERGRKLLIREGALYPAGNGMRLFLPADDFETGREYTVRVECGEEGGGRMRSRTFWVRGGG